MFEGLGFKEIARAEPYAALLESGMDSVANFCRRINEQGKSLPQDKRAALVVNCNPFTLGHSALIQKAAYENEAVIVFIVSEDRSLFPFDVRVRLVKEGLADLKNVLVVAGGDYIISQATFPGYFTRGEDTVAAQTQLDAMLFATKIAPALGIKTRYVGEEPYCPVTRTYNKALEEILPRYGIELKIIRRLEVDGDIISASKVRDMLRQDDWEGIKKAVPENTYNFLTSDEAQMIIGRIKQSQSRH
jgi:[citrate (pro-3S)-lyase] ligase